jgi:predicted CoA-substrate-specific enzyme activase
MRKQGSFTLRETYENAAIPYRLGLDIGSTTIKAAVLDSGDSLIWSCYRRHFSDLGKAMADILAQLADALGDGPVRGCVTGSGGLSLSEKLGLPFVQEVIAGSRAVRRYHPEVTAVLELGGEDAKLTFLKPGLDHRMNGICAGGTGAFIDQMALLLKTDAAGLDGLAAKSRTVYPIAARCGVFAKTDIQALLNDGAGREDIAASVFQAAVNQTVAGLSCGRKIQGKVCFIGGPLHFLPQLRRRFQKTLGLGADEILLPDAAPVFVAIGAALAAPCAVSAADDTTEPVSLRTLANRLSAAGLRDVSAAARLQPLFDSAAEYRAFCRRHASHPAGRREPETCRGNAYLGLDAGSTTCKCVLIDEEARILFSRYANNDGSPLDCAAGMLRALYDCLPAGVTIARAAVTGYGENLIKNAFSFDMGEVETVAHFTAADHFLPGVETILDIGGQDMKYLRAREGFIETVVLNEACSSGCGSFIQTFAESLGLGIQDFAGAAVAAEAPVDLGSRCTVFMNSRVRQAQKDGMTVGDIAAGLCYAVVKNALFKVIKLKGAGELGDKIIVQGGTFKNDAVLRCFERIAGKEAVRPDIAELMGAFGAALLAKKTWQPGRSSALIPPEALPAFSYRTTAARCGRCQNNCLLTVTSFDHGDKPRRRLVTGNRCEKGAGDDASEGIPNLYDYKYRRLFDYKPLALCEAPLGTIGIPRVLNMYENYPFWHTFFTALGFRVVLSPPSDRGIYELGMDTISSDTACYPAKLANGHVVALIHQGIRRIFLPCVPKEQAEFKNADNHYNCPIVTCYAEVLKANIELLKTKEVLFHNPFLPYHNRKRLTERLLEEFEDVGLSYAAVAHAVEAAFREDMRFKSDIRRKGEEVLEELRRTGKSGIVLSGRPYHLDPEVHHGIPNLIASLGLAVLTEDAVAHLGQADRPLRVLDQWMYHTRLYEAADFVSKQDNLELVQLNSFGCGPDSIAAEQAQEILTKRHKLYTLIKIDEVSNLGAVKIRLRSLKAAITARRQAAGQTQPAAACAERCVPDRPHRQYTIIGPQMAPIHFTLIQEAIRSEGYRFEILETVENADIEEGLRYVNNDSCYPAIIIIGQLLRALKSGKYDPDSTAILMSQTGGPCRASNYVALLEMALEKNGFSRVPIISLTVNSHSRSSRLKITLPLVKKAVMAMIYGDLLMKVLYQTRPYEKSAGEADRLYGRWLSACKDNVRQGDRKTFRQNLGGIARDFDRVEIAEAERTKVGLVGEILVKYHPAANNNMAAFLEQSGAEMTVPSLVDFFLYCALVREYNHRYLDGGSIARFCGNVFTRIVEAYRDDMREALRQTSRFKPPATIFEMTEKAKTYLSLCNHTGEGWLLTAEIVDLIENGADSIVCMQPFACLPNHISGRGMMKRLKERYPQVNIIAIDYDAGASAVNQINRIKLLLESGKVK